MEIYPDFYDRFFCLAGACRHSCCREGWEIDVDDATLARYRALESPLGEELRAALTRSPDGSWSLALREDGVCPLLREDGLCRVILALGEDGLCDICALHPRFYLDVGDQELAGVGLCCEAAVALLLEGDGPLAFLTEEDKALSLPQLLSLLGLAPDDVPPYLPTVDPDRCRAILARYAQCEAISEDWTRDLAALAADPDRVAQAAGVYIKSYNLALWDRIYGYLLYRQLELAQTWGLPALARYAREAADFVLLWTAVTGDLAECLRRWSAQTEYSTENVELLLGGLT